MCTIVLIRNGLCAGYPLAIAANRDEYLDRPSEAPEDRGNGILAPRDVKRGGTWIGVNQYGVFAGLTNRNGVIGKPGKISRGDLPNMALRYKTATEAFEAIRDAYPDGKEFNGFYLVIADAEKAYLFGGDGMHLTHREVTENVLAVTNRGVGTVGDVGVPETPRRVSHIITTWEKTKRRLDYEYTGLTRNEDSDIGMMDILVDLLHIHDEDRHGTCVNEIEKGYGTKSSSIMLLDNTERDDLIRPKGEWLYAHRERQGNKHICNFDFVYHSWSLT